MTTTWESIGAKGVRHLTTDLQALADFLPALQQSEFKAGEWTGGNETKSGVIQMPYVSYTPVVDAFYKAAYEHGWVKAFDWSAWGKSEEGELLRKDETAIRSATPEQLANLLTVCVRADRFIEGFLLGEFETGLILRIVERAAVLAGEASAR